MERLFREVRLAWREFWRRPGLTAVALGSLALGIGANAAIFTLIDQAMLRTLPVPRPERLVSLEEAHSGTYPFFRFYLENNTVFAHLVASSRTLPAGLRLSGATSVETVRVAYVSGNFFQGLGVGAAAGRVLLADDEFRQTPVAVISAQFWERRFGASPGVIGQTLRLDSLVVEVAGVSEPGFSGIFHLREGPDLFLPLPLFPLANPNVAQAWNTPNMDWLYPIGRLREGVTEAQAQAALRALWPQAVEAVNGAAKKEGRRVRDYSGTKPVELRLGSRGVASSKGWTPFLALAAATGLVLLITCANVANLLLARGVARAREMALRTALGATRRILIRQLLVESALLGALGGLLGITVCVAGVQLLRTLQFVEKQIHAAPSLKVLLFAMLLTTATTLLFGLLPALKTSATRVAEALKDGGTAGESRSKLFLGKCLVAGQVALTFTLLAGAGLFLRTLLNLRSVDTGFSPAQVLVADVDPTRTGYRENRLRLFYERLLDQARTLPGVQSAALSLMTPMGEYAMTSTFSAEGYSPSAGERLLAYRNPVSSQYFTTLGIPMLLGRDFRPSDEPLQTPRMGLMGSIGRSGGGSDEPSAIAARVCIVNESLARKLFGTRSPLGMHLSYDDQFTMDRALEIIGVVKDVRHWSLHEADEIGVIYVPSWAGGAEARWLLLRTTGPAEPVAERLRAVLTELDPAVPLLRTIPMREQVARQYQQERLLALLCGLFGLIALLLAGLGVYGVLAFSVARRGREIGIRMALGAEVDDVARMVARESLAPVVSGLAAGALGSLAAERLTHSLLFGVAPYDPASMLLAATTLAVASLLAAAGPALRAARLDPVRTLRQD
jgi:predicted permease